MLALAATHLGCLRGEPDRSSASASNLVVVIAGGMRADRPAPFVESLATAGVAFRDARAASSFGPQSLAALLSGRLPSRTGALGWTAAPPADARTFAPLLARAGYTTAFFATSGLAADPRFTRGFAAARQLTDGASLSKAAAAFAETAKEPFALVLYYAAPATRDRVVSLESARFDDLVARYDAAIADTDAALAALVAGLKAAGVLERTVIVVTSDHGEEFLEHGFVEHAWTVYDEVLRVPLIFWPKTALPPMQDGRRASAVDVLPTLLAIAGITERPGDLDGRSLFDESAQPIFAELVIEERSVVRTVINDRWKYIAAAKWLPPAERPAAARVENDLRKHGGDRSFDRCGPATHEELYDLVQDPGEQRNVLAAQPGRLELLRAQLGHLIADCRQHAPTRGDVPVPLGAVDPARERLRALGYVE